MKTIYKLLSGCALVIASAWVAAATMSDAQSAIASAETALAEVRSTEGAHEWTTTAPLLKSAQEALQASDYAQAQELANEAQAQAEATITQVELNKLYWQVAVPR